MTLIRSALLALATAATLLGAADAKPGKAKEGPRTGEAGKADAEAAFARQKDKAPAAVGGSPVVIGSYVWGGRADEQYKPFFQWEFRLKAGDADLAGLRGRTITLNPDGTDAATGAWKDLGRLAAKQTLDVSIRQNCPAFQSYRLELAWDGGGTATFACADKTTLPMSSASFAEMAYLVTTGYLHDAEENKATQQKRKRSNKGFEVSWWLWNLGGAPATEVVQTVRFLDLNGKEVHRETVKLKDPVAAGARLEQTLTLKEPPKGYQLLSVTADCAVPVVAIAADGGTFTGATEIEVVGISVADGKLSAKVRNGLKKDLAGLVVNVTLLDADAKPITMVKLPCGDLASGAKTEVSAPTTATSFLGYEIGWDIAGSAPKTAAPSGDLTVDGITFRLGEQQAKDGSLAVSGTLTNTRSDGIPGFTATFISGGSEVTWACDDLAAGASVDLTLDFPGLKRLDALQMRWVAK